VIVVLALVSSVLASLVSASVAAASASASAVVRYRGFAVSARAGHACSADGSPRYTA
jgi:hypothetical protein